MQPHSQVVWEERESAFSPPAQPGNEATQSGSRVGGLFFVPIASIAEDSLQCCMNKKISGPHLPWLLGYM